MGMGRQRIVKKETWNSYISSLPTDVWLISSEFYQVYMADFFTYDVQTFLSIAFGAIFNFLTLWLRGAYLLEINSLQESSTLKISDYLLASEQLKQRVDRRFVVFGMIPILISVINALIVFTRFRTYTLFQADLDQLVDSSGFLKSSSLQYVDFQYPKISEEDEQPAATSWLDLLVWWKSHNEKDEGENNDNQSNSVRSLVLYIWNGPFLPFSMILLCLYSPVHVLLFFCSIHWDGFTSLVLLHLGFTGTMAILVWYYTQLLHDREILFSQVQHEQNIGSVYPQIHELNHLRQLKEAYEKALVKAHIRENSFRRRINIKTDLDNQSLCDSDPRLS